MADSAVIRDKVHSVLALLQEVQLSETLRERCFSFIRGLGTALPALPYTSLLDVRAALLAADQHPHFTHRQHIKIRDWLFAVEAILFRLGYLERVAMRPSEVPGPDAAMFFLPPCFHPYSAERWMPSLTPANHHESRNVNFHHRQQLSNHHQQWPSWQRRTPPANWPMAALPSTTSSLHAIDRTAANFIAASSGRRHYGASRLSAHAPLEPTRSRMPRPPYHASSTPVDQYTTANSMATPSQPPVATPSADETPPALVHSPVAASSSEVDVSSPRPPRDVPSAASSSHLKPELAEDMLLIPTTAGTTEVVTEESTATATEVHEKEETASASFNVDVVVASEESSENSLIVAPPPHCSDSSCDCSDTCPPIIESSDDSLREQPVEVTATVVCDDVNETPIPSTTEMPLITEAEDRCARLSEQLKDLTKQMCQTTDELEVLRKRVNDDVVDCPVCLERILPGGLRPVAWLTCSHRFHLDCVGSAFNAKTRMECPCCRKVDTGTWQVRFRDSSSSRPSPPPPHHAPGFMYPYEVIHYARHRDMMQYAW
mmetsp:Transcript_13282/g.21800  ORF Transcript_13282/g.21800 Transcript_13282/m.21800 type:complete len:545 (+) Transcript_13282:2-1636(+)